MDISFGMNPVEYYGNNFEGKKPCTDYVFEKKQERSIEKLFNIIEQFKLNDFLKKPLKTELKQIESCKSKDELVRFLTTEFKSVEEVQKFFKTFSKK